MTVLEYRADGDCELVLAVGAPSQPGPCLGECVWLDVGKLGLICAFAFRADNAIRPKNSLKVFAGLFICAETVKELNQG